MELGVLTQLMCQRNWTTVAITENNEPVAIILTVPKRSDLSEVGLNTPKVKVVGLSSSSCDGAGKSAHVEVKLNVARGAKVLT